MAAWTALAATAALLAACGQEERTARQDYAAFCAGCHGADGSGTGPTARDWPRPVPDLRTLATRNGGPFPTAYVVSTLLGRDRPDAHGAMPRFWGDIGGDLTVLDTPEGGVRVPERALALARYVERLGEGG
ncbi:c-type cytochrome [Tranquillimonas alkanivorans]|nr:c-type cytochrome [Tranquillimonas alkanivorans]